MKEKSKKKNLTQYLNTQAKLQEKQADILENSLVGLSRDDLSRVKEKLAEQERDNEKQQMYGNYTSSNGVGAYVDKSVVNNTYRVHYNDKNVFEFFLMHRSMRVAIIKMLIVAGKVIPLRIKVIDPERLPVALTGLPIPVKFISEAGVADEMYRNFLTAFTTWYNDRLVPDDREGIKDIIKNFSEVFEMPEILITEDVTEDVTEDISDNNSDNKIAKDKNSDIMSFNDVSYPVNYYLNFLSILSYGRSIKDKYWLNPVNHKRTDVSFDMDKYLGINFTDKDNLFFDYGVNISTRDSVVYRHKDYKGMDFTKNGVSDLFHNLAVGKKLKKDTPLLFNTPDFCTDGKVRKSFKKDSGVLYLEKHYPVVGSEINKDLADRVKLMLDLNKEMPKVFPLLYPIYTDDVLTGYKTECFLDGYSELATTKEILNMLLNKNAARGKTLSVSNLVNDKEKRDGYIKEAAELFVAFIYKNSSKWSKELASGDVDKVCDALCNITKDAMTEINIGLSSDLCFMFMNDMFDNNEYDVSVVKNAIMDTGTDVSDTKTLSYMEYLTPKRETFVYTVILLMERFNDAEKVATYLLENTGFTYGSETRVMNKFIGW